MARSTNPEKFLCEAETLGVDAAVKQAERRSSAEVKVVLVPWWTKRALTGALAGLILVATSLFRNGKRGWGWVVAGSIVVLVLAFVWLLRRTLRALPQGDLTSGGWSSFGAGWGGFGGGFSGGGGATGSW